MGAVATHSQSQVPASGVADSEGLEATAQERERTLADVIGAAWHEAAVDGRTACPVCGWEMRFADRDLIRCDGCGSELS